MKLFQTNLFLQITIYSIVAMIIIRLGLPSSVLEGGGGVLLGIMYLASIGCIFLGWSNQSESDLVQARTLEHQTKYAAYQAIQEAQCKELELLRYKESLKATNEHTS